MSLYNEEDRNLKRKREIDKKQIRLQKIQIFKVYKEKKKEKKKEEIKFNIRKRVPELLLRAGATPLGPELLL